MSEAQVQAMQVLASRERLGVGRPRRHRTAPASRLSEVAGPDFYRLLAEVLAGALACRFHRGVIAGTLEAFGEQDATVRPASFVENDLCIARDTRWHRSSTTRTPSMERP